MNKKKGFTLFEVLISITLLAVVLLGVTRVLQVQINTMKTMDRQIHEENQLRYVMTSIENQLKKSDVIIYYAGRYYMEDPENREYFHYYSLQSSHIYKNKTSKTLTPIGLGSKTQVLNQIVDFTMYYEDPFIHLNITREKDGRAYSSGKNIYVKGKLIHVRAQ